MRLHLAGDRVELSPLGVGIRACSEYNNGGVSVGLSTAINVCVVQLWRIGYRISILAYRYQSAWRISRT